MASVLGRTHRREHRDRRGMSDGINRIFRIIPAFRGVILSNSWLRLCAPGPHN